MEDHKDKAYTPNIRESVESMVEGGKPIKLQMIPGIPRWDLMRAQRLTNTTAKGNPSV